eukprot:GEMP01063379.1.p1 GENE.GEMP01063379.1~~GEMP01063379.1.p1  ORF type:complete len:284 (+),score=64.78 GEMP01063379.1:82-933(+)
MVPDVDVDALGRQLEELEALCAIYQDDIEVDHASREAIEQYIVGVRTTLAVNLFQGREARPLFGDFKKGGTQAEPSRSATSTPRFPCGLGQEPPRLVESVRYLAEDVWEPPMCFVANASQELLEEVISREYTGSECLLPVLQEMQELFREPEEEQPEAADDDGYTEIEYDNAYFAMQESLQESQKPTQLGRRLMYSHHILASSKRRAIVDWAKQLELGGFSKIGYPGVIVVEGDEDNVRSYVDALTRLRWKHFVVRGEEIVSIPSGVALDTMIGIVFLLTIPA